MKFSGLLIALLLSACSSGGVPNSWSGTLGGTDSVFGSEPKGTKYVSVLGRSWAVFPVPGYSDIYVAQRDNLDLNPYGAPPYRRAPQALRAIEMATGCRVVRSDFVTKITGRYFASVACK